MRQALNAMSVKQPLCYCLNAKKSLNRDSSLSIFLIFQATGGKHLCLLNKPEKSQGHVENKPVCKYKLSRFNHCVLQQLHFKIICRF
jgi:hypothetical protein